MSRATKRKHVLNEVEQTFFTLPTENQQIVKVLAGRGNNLHEVQSASGITYLVSMPTKFRKNLWVKRGDYVLVEPIEEGDRVKAEIVRILLDDAIKHFQLEGIWPKEFSAKDTSSCGDKLNSIVDARTNEFINTNRRPIESSDEDSDSDNNEDGCDDVQD